MQPCRVEFWSLSCILPTAVVSKRQRCGLSWAPVAIKPCHSCLSGCLARWWELVGAGILTPLSPQMYAMKSSLESMDAMELDFRMRLAEVQRRYKEKQRELVKLQRRRDSE